MSEDQKIHFGKKHVCPLCGSDRVVEIAKSITSTGKKKYKQTYHCTKCGYEWSFNKTETIA